MFDEIDSDDDIFKPKKGMTDKEVDETCEYLKNHPLTMTSVPENIENNPLLKGI